MAMTPQEKREFSQLKELVDSIVRVENVPFIQSLNRRIDGIEDTSTTTTVTSLEQAVNESGTGTYNVSRVPDRKVGVTFTDGTTGFIGVYNL